jgi:hypothetical protein
MYHISSRPPLFAGSADPPGSLSAQLTAPRLSQPQAFPSIEDLEFELGRATELHRLICTALMSLPTSVLYDAELLAVAPAKVSASAAAPAAAPAAADGKTRGRGRRARESPRGSGSDSPRKAESPAGSEDDAEGVADEDPGFADRVSTLRLRGIVAWRLQRKLVLAELMTLLSEYQQALKDELASVQNGREEGELVEGGGTGEAVSA